MAPRGSVLPSTYYFPHQGRWIPVHEVPGQDCIRVGFGRLCITGTLSIRSCSGYSFADMRIGRGSAVYRVVAASCCFLVAG